MNKIDSFTKEYFFLSNFYPTEVEYNGLTYHSSEAAFQAQKCKREEDRDAFAEMTAAESKKAGRSVDLREDWEEIKYDVMKKMVNTKFWFNPELRDKLLATGDAYLEEGNTWGDTYWGTVNGVGENNLGKILMEVRDGIRKLLASDSGNYTFTTHYIIKK